MFFSWTLFTVLVFTLLLLFFFLLKEWNSASDRLTGRKDLESVSLPVPPKKRLGKKAIVVGASWAGCLSAQVLLNHFDEVVVIENEDLSTEVVTTDMAVKSFLGEEGGSKPRSNIPQLWFAHTLMPFGVKTAQAIFGDSFTKLLYQHGALPCDMGDWSFHHYGVDIEGPSLGLGALIASRCLLESAARHHLFVKSEAATKEGRLQYLPNHQVRGLLLQEEDEEEEGGGSTTGTGGRKGGRRRRVVGVQVKNNQDHEVPLEEMEADLVVDASGRSQLGRKWFEKHGIDIPMEQFDAKMCYSGAIFSHKEKKLNYQGLMLSFGDARDFSRISLFVDVEGDYTIFTLLGAAGNHCPTEMKDIKEWLKGAPIPERTLKQLEQFGEPVWPFRSYKPGPSSMIKYQDCPNLPEGFVAVGDAYTTFNPQYGQGLTTSGMGALTLDRVLRNAEFSRSESKSGSVRMSADYFQLLSERLKVAWMLPKSGDYSFPTTEPAEGETGRELKYRFFQAYVSSVAQLSSIYPHVRVRFLKTIGMADFGAKLFLPDISFLVLAYTLFPGSLFFSKVKKTESLPDPKTHPYVNPKLPLRPS